jgi:uncharacterized cofD-like protein
MRHEKIVVIGGGTGTYAVLMGLKQYSRNITTIVTMADDGGSSGRLRDEFGHLPPGDARRSLVALSANGEVNKLLRTLFEYRFDKGHGLNGHSFGNLFLTALTELTGSTEMAIQEAARLLNIRGRVLPVTVCNTRLWAELEDGTYIRGEHNIDVRTVKPELHISRVFLRPEAEVYPPAAEAIRSADILVLGPGDLYTSLIPNLLVGGVPEAIQECKGTRILVCNLMTKHGETDGFRASDFVSEMGKYLCGVQSLDVVIVNSGVFPSEVLEAYAAEHAHPVEVDLDRCQALVPHIVQGDLTAQGSLVRHDSKKLARVIAQARKTFNRAERELEAVASAPAPPTLEECTA